jgi:hypothetical protein
MLNDYLKSIALFLHFLDFDDFYEIIINYYYPS